MNSDPSACFNKRVNVSLFTYTTIPPKSDPLFWVKAAAELMVSLELDLLVGMSGPLFCYCGLGDTQNRNDRAIDISCHRVQLEKGKSKKLSRGLVGKGDLNFMPLIDVAETVGLLAATVISLFSV